MSQDTEQVAVEAWAPLLWRLENSSQLLSHQVSSRPSSLHWPSHEPRGRSAGQGEETGVLVMTSVISGKSVNLSAPQYFHLCKGALGLVMPNFPSSVLIILIIIF